MQGSAICLDIERFYLIGHVHGLNEIYWYCKQFNGFQMAVFSNFWELLLAYGVRWIAFNVRGLKQGVNTVYLRISRRLV